VFEVENSGSVIRETEREQIFQKGYSTKPQTAGKVKRIRVIHGARNREEVWRID
jgi:sensor histidine kinase regulating citrate/malate metabolism